MAYDERLAQRLRKAIGGTEDVAERKMFGGLAFLLCGHMCCGIVGNDLMVRVGRERYKEALSKPNTRPMDFTGHPSRGMVYVAPAGVRTEAALRKWVQEGVAYVLTLPTKTERRPSPRTRRRP